MTAQSREVVLFPDEIISWDEVVKLVVVLRIPFRHKAKGIDCIEDYWSSHQPTPTSPASWFTYSLKPSHIQFIAKHLDKLPHLEGPVPRDVARAFIDDFILLKDAPSIIPIFLTTAGLKLDSERRDTLFNHERDQLQELVSKNKISIIDTSRRICSHITYGVQLTRNEAILYLEERGLSDLAFLSSRSVKDQIREPESIPTTSTDYDTYHGFSKELFTLGIHEYKKLLITRKHDSIANNIILEQKEESLERVSITESHSGDTDINEQNSVAFIEEVAHSPTTETDITDQPEPTPKTIVSRKTLQCDRPAQDTSSIYKNTKGTSKAVNAPSTDEIELVTRKLIGTKEVMQLLGVSRPTIYNYLNPGSPSFNEKFPQPIKLNSENRWYEYEIYSFLESLTNTHQKKKETDTLTEIGISIRAVNNELVDGCSATPSQEEQGRPLVTNSATSPIDSSTSRLGKAITAPLKPEHSVKSPEFPVVLSPQQPVSLPENAPNVAYEVMLGTNDDSPQYGLLGELSGKKVALDLNHTHTISLFGVQGGGKSYTLGTIVEMASRPLKHINLLPNPLATLIFHYSPTQDYAPEFASMINANSIEDEISTLHARYKATPEALQDLIIITPRSKVSQRRSEYPNIEVHPLSFSSSELNATHWKFLMGAVGNQRMYMRMINKIMRNIRTGLTIEALKESIEDSELSDSLKGLANTRLSFACEYLDDQHRFRDLIRPGRVIIVDLRDEYIEKNEAIGLFVVMLQIFSEATYRGATYNKLVVFDEAHKYIEDGNLFSRVIEVVREMRHKGTNILIASQDPPSVPVSLIELSSQIILHRFNSPAWLKHIQKANSALSTLTPEEMSGLRSGEAFVWSAKASHDAFSKGAVKIKCRPRITQHGGSTKTAVCNNN